jgi:hypothetical protein
MEIAECPFCANDIVFDLKPQLRQRVVCPVCEMKLRVILVDPEIELDLEKWDEGTSWNRKRTRRSKDSLGRKKPPFDTEDEEDEEEERPQPKPKKRSKRTRRKYDHTMEEDDL